MDCEPMKKNWPECNDICTVHQTLERIQAFTIAFQIGMLGGGFGIVDPE